MSEEANASVAAPAAPEPQIESTSAPVETSPPETTAAEPVATEQKTEFPKKFLKADGTPDYDKLAKSYLGLEKKLGAKPFVPAQSADEYEWQPPEDAVPLDDARVAEFKAQALAKGFTTEQYKFVMDSHNAVIKSMLDTVGWSAEKADATLKKEWGSDFQANVKAAQVGFSEFAPSSADPNDPVWNHPEVMKLLARMGSEVREDSLSGVGTPGGAGESVQEQINALRNSPDYWKPENQAKVMKLYERLEK